MRKHLHYIKQAMHLVYMYSFHTNNQYHDYGTAYDDITDNKNLSKSYMGKDRSLRFDSQSWYLLDLAVDINQFF